MIYVVNFPFCNFYSLQRYLRVNNLSYLELDSSIALDPSDIVILPGVGTFEKGIDFLRNECLFTVIANHALAKGTVIGICLGMQMLLEASEESPGVNGLNLISGSCKLIPESPAFQVPHIGWNELNYTKYSDSVFFDSASTLISSADYYFVHSFHAAFVPDQFITSTFSHPTGPLVSSIRKDNIIGFQFHPEKSGKAGYKLLNTILMP